MNEKRTLWILAAVGVFLLIVVSVAAIVYRPGVDDDAPLIAQNPAASVWAGNAVSTGTANDAALSAVETPAVTSITEASELTVITGTTNVYSTGTTATFDLNTTSSASGAEKAAVRAETAKAGSVKTESVKPAYTEPQKQAKPATSAAASTKSSAPATQTKTSSSTAKTGNFWVQAAAYTQKKHAENAKNVLSENKMISEIFTFSDSKGTTFYRLRVGPYTTKNEADFWRNRIALIEDFKDAQTVAGN